MSINPLAAQRRAVDDLHARVQVNSAKAVGARRALSDRRRAILGRPATVVVSYAAGFFLAARKSPKRVAETMVGSTTQKSRLGLSWWSVLNTGLAFWAILKRVDKLNQSNMPDSDDLKELSPENEPAQLTPNNPPA